MNRCVQSMSRWLIPAFATACLATGALAQQGPPTFGVNVLNTPLAVTGSVTTSGSVSLAPGSSVSVINQAQNPVPVQDIREPFQARGIGSIGASTPATFPAVPAGKRLVIEHVSLRVNNGTTASPDTCALTNSDPLSGVDQIVPQPVGGNALNHIFGASVQTKFYVQTGQTPQIFCDFFGGASGDIEAFISG